MSRFARILHRRPHTARARRPRDGSPASLLLVALLLAAALMALVAAPAAAQIGPSGLPLPRFVSLKSDRINVRAGPGQDYRVTWTFSRAGLPVEIVAESGNWRRIRDSDGTEGWVFHSLLSGRRTGVVEPWSKSAEPLPLHARAGNNAPPVAFLEPGVLVDLQGCDGTWCEVSVEGITGWLKQEALWGAYPKEVVR